MLAATLKSTGMIAVPEAIRDLLKLEPGDTVEFVVSPNGTVQIRAVRFDVSALRGLLRKPGRTPASLQAMDEAIRTF